MIAVTIATSPSGKPHPTNIDTTRAMMPKVSAHADMPREGGSGFTGAHCTGASRSGAVTIGATPTGAVGQRSNPPRCFPGSADSASTGATSGEGGSIAVGGSGGADAGAGDAGGRGCGGRARCRRGRRGIGASAARAASGVGSRGAGHAASSATWISRDGQGRVGAEAPRRWRVTGHDELRREGRDHGAVVGAQRQRGDPEGDARGIRSLDRHVAQATVRDHAAAEQQSRHAVVGARREGLRDQHVHDRFAEGCRDIGHRHRLAERLALLGPPGDGGLQA